jgi:2-keto-4-pentenoate hydratase
MDRLAEQIAAARLSGSELEEPIGPLDLAEGYAIQAQVAERLGRQVGWKAGATNATGQRFLGVDGPIFGRVLAGGLRQSGDRGGLPGARSGEAEPEIALRLDDSGKAAAAYLAIEVNRPSRSDAFALGAGFIVADNAAHCALVIGPEIPLEALDEPEAITVTFGLRSRPAETGNAAAVLGNPLRALEALAAARPLSAGDWIASGAITRSCPFSPDDEIVADFGRWGSVSVRW